ncbi:PQQ-dependent sugar dehydrogenase [Halegenticoccus soli]|uniref:PQQ-dependent sugar dehydrogenase n=1 Tax=Halegenticoccus soli TaxID=1985678 RepID=UPI000C6CF432|nr:PQQ-dependent sugar dehydrogenase [Halegenticoccus soli]
MPNGRRAFLGALAGVGTVASLVDGRVSGVRRAQTRRSDGSTGYFPPGPTVRADAVAEGVTAPTDAAVASPGDDRLFVAEQPGRVVAVDPTDGRVEPFVDVRNRLVALNPSFDERGLTGIEFHPAFEENGRFFLHYSAPPRADAPPNFDHTEVISEFEATTDRSAGLPGSERALMEIPHPQSTHNAGPMAFGPDGYLYVPMGDGGGANDDDPGHLSDWYARNAGGNAQNVSTLLGKVLRVDVDGREEGKPYAIPDDNPLVGRPGRDELYAWGFRNPWGISFDDRGRLFVADVGQQLYEEVNLVEKGGNYGWNVREGTHCFDAENAEEPPADCPTSTPPDVRGGEPLRDPIFEYPHRYRGETVGNAVVGGYFYRTDGGPDFYAFGDYAGDVERSSGRLFVAFPPEEAAPPPGSPQREVPNAPIWRAEELRVRRAGTAGLGAFLRAIGRGPDGDLYLLCSRDAGLAAGNGTVLRLARPFPSDG